MKLFAKTQSTPGSQLTQKGCAGSRAGQPWKPPAPFCICPGEGRALRMALCNRQSCKEACKRKAWSSTVTLPNGGVTARAPRHTCPPRWLGQLAPHRPCRHSSQPSKRKQRIPQKQWLQRAIWGSRCHPAAPSASPSCCRESCSELCGWEISPPAAEDSVALKAVWVMGFHPPCQDAQK